MKDYGSSQDENRPLSPASYGAIESADATALASMASEQREHADTKMTENDTRKLNIPIGVQITLAVITICGFMFTQFTPLRVDIEVLKGKSKRKYTGDSFTRRPI